MKRKRKESTLDPSPLAAKPKRTPPFLFVLEALAALDPITRPMFGCLAVYIGERIVLILRDRPNHPGDNGVWLATTKQHHAALRPEFPNMRSIGFLREGVTEWQLLPIDSPDFEESALHACELIRARDPRIGKIPSQSKKNAKRS
jgi:hypothetical protein